MEINFIDQYVPTIPELDQSEVLSTRRRLQEYCTLAFPDIANLPGTVIGDLIVTPQAYVITALEEGVSKILSDVSLENVSNGIVYNCDFVRQYLKNFGIDDMQYKLASGVVRMIFSENKLYVLQRGTQFKLDDSHIFNLFLPNDGDLVCAPEGSAYEFGKNMAILKDAGDGTWFCDVTIVGTYNEQEIVDNVIEGTVSELAISTYIPELTKIFLTSKLVLIQNTDSIVNLAKKAQLTSFSASLNTRNGAIQYVNTTCPFVQSVFAIKDGDNELIRTYRNGYGIPSGCMDLYVRTSHYETTEQQQVKLVKNGDYLEGKWDYIGQPYHLESITHPSLSVLDIEEGREIISTSNPDLNLGALAAYTPYEELKIRIPDRVDEYGDSIYNLQRGSDGKEYTYFTVTYQTDPLVHQIAQTVSNTDYAPINVNILTKGFTPVIIRKFEVVYVKKAGVIPDYKLAEDEIKIYFGKVGAPYQYAESEIAKIMDKAGVQYMKTINVEADVQWTIADKIQDFSGNLISWDSGIPTVQIRSSDDLRVYYPAYTEEMSADSMFACSPRTIRYYIMEGAITFKEERDA